jgi:hypothetical protein
MCIDDPTDVNSHHCNGLSYKSIRSLLFTLSTWLLADAAACDWGERVLGWYLIRVEGVLVAIFDPMNQVLFK